MSNKIKYRIEKQAPEGNLKQKILHLSILLNFFYSPFKEDGAT